MMSNEDANCKSIIKNKKPSLSWGLLVVLFLLFNLVIKIEVESVLWLSGYLSIVYSDFIYHQHLDCNPG